MGRKKQDTVTNARPKGRKREFQRKKVKCRGNSVCFGVQNDLE